MWYDLCMTTNDDNEPEPDLAAVIRDDSFLDAVANDHLAAAIELGDDQLLMMFLEFRAELDD